MKYVRTLLLILGLMAMGKIFAQAITPEMLARAKAVCRASEQHNSFPGIAGDEGFDSVTGQLFDEFEIFLSIPDLPLIALSDSLCIHHVKSPDGKFVIFSLDERTGGTFRSSFNFRVDIDSTGLHWHHPFDDETGHSELGIVTIDTIQFRGKVFYFYEYMAAVSASMVSTEIVIADDKAEFRESISWYYCPWLLSGSWEAEDKYDPAKKLFHHQHAESAQYYPSGERNFTRINKDGWISDPSSIIWD